MGVEIGRDEIKTIEKFLFKIKSLLKSKCVFNVSIVSDRDVWEVGRRVSQFRPY